jgi:radical SAM superfamily enzyme YgiQ (UPF0313 family)
VKALLVSPVTQENMWDLRHVLKAMGKKALHPPLGLLTIASFMPEEWQLRFVDMNCQDLSNEMIQWADMVFMSALIAHDQSVLDVVKRAHALDKKVVAGGPLFTVAPEEFDFIDHLVLNEGEVTFPLFLRDLALGKKPNHLYVSEERPDLSLSPPPRWDLVNKNHYVFVSIQFSRGCPFDCEFCGVAGLLGREIRTKSSAQIIRELEIFYEMGWRGRVFFNDDNFIGSKTNAKSLLRTLVHWQQEHGFPFEFHTQASIDIAEDDELMDLMTQAGFDFICLGIESPVEDSLKECGKHNNVGKDLLKAIRRIQSKGIEAVGSFIIGFDSDPPDIAKRQIDFIRESGIVIAHLSLLQPYPGTRLYHRLKNEGRLLRHQIRGIYDGSLNFVPKADANEVEASYFSALDELYAPEGYYRRIMRFLEHYKPLPIHRSKAIVLKSILGAIVFPGILDNGRRHFWRLFMTVVQDYRGSLSKIMNHSILGYHIRMKLAGKKARGDIN